MGSIIEKLETLIAPLKRRVMLMVARGVVRLVNDGGKVQMMQVSLLSDEIRDGIESIGHFGFSSVPPLNSEVVVLFHAGNRDHGIVISTGHRDSRPQGLEEGEAVIYGLSGNFIKLNKDGSIQVTAPGNVIIDGNVKVNGEVDANDCIGGGISLKSHTHPVPQNPDTLEPN